VSDSARCDRQQTTVTLNSAALAADTAIRGGSYASMNFDGGVLVTRVSDNPDLIRRSLLNFDTDSTVPARAAIQSAILSVTVKWGGVMPTRQVGVFPRVL
jgi:hypothetical protein